MNTQEIVKEVAKLKKTAEEQKTKAAELKGRKTQIVKDLSTLLNSKSEDAVELLNLAEETMGILKDDMDKKEITTLGKTMQRIIQRTQTILHRNSKRIRTINSQTS